MSSLLLTLARENPWPGIALASLNFMIALSLVGMSLLLAVTIAALAWLHELADREPAPLDVASRPGFGCPRRRSVAPHDNPGGNSDMLDVIEVFDVVHPDPGTGHPVWTGLDPMFAR
jgi:hypothetical protein